MRRQSSSSEITVKRLGIDPALAGGVVLTTVTDVVDLFSFLGFGFKLNWFRHLAGRKAM